MTRWRSSAWRCFCLARPFAAAASRAVLTCAAYRLQARNPVRCVRCARCAIISSALWRCWCASAALAMRHAANAWRSSLRRWCAAKLSRSSRTACSLREATPCQAMNTAERRRSAASSMHRLRSDECWCWSEALAMRHAEKARRAHRAWARLPSCRAACRAARAPVHRRNYLRCWFASPPEQNRPSTQDGLFPPGLLRKSKG